MIIILKVKPTRVPSKLQSELSYQSMLNDMRRTVATEFLQNTHLLIDQVAERVGFSDATSFRKAFRKWTGHSPTHYRRAGSDAPVPYHFHVWGIDFACPSRRACDIDVKHKLISHRQMRRVRHGYLLREPRSFVSAKMPLPLSLRERIWEQ